MRRATIYALTDEVGNIRYIGQTIRTLEARFDGHMKEAHKRPSAKGEWLKATSAKIVSIASALDADECERAMILQCRQDGFDLLNVRPGGRDLDLRGKCRPKTMARRSATRGTPPPVMTPEVFRSWIDAMGITQKQAAKLLDYSEQTISNWLSGKRPDGAPAPIPPCISLACSAIYHRFPPWKAPAD
jgi:DNA-binding transcriptional regulator YiaG